MRNIFLSILLSIFSLYTFAQMPLPTKERVKWADCEIGALISFDINVYEPEYQWRGQLDYNPGKVSCIYAEAPVCDITSWPGGFGEGKGSPQDWEQLKAAYAFKTDEEAKAYRGNPIDNLEKLAENKIPVLHTVGLNDKIVPIEENTFKLVDRYLKLGGIATVVPCTTGEHKLEGHHFDIDDPALIADFIHYHSKKASNRLNSEDYHKLRAGIRNSFIKFENEKKGRVAFLGGSITYNGGWRDSICNYLKNRFPDTDFDFIAAGIPSMGTTPAAFRLKRDILKNGPVDLLFEEAAVNDAANGRSKAEQLRAMEGIIRGVRSQNPACDVILMHFTDPGKMDMYRNNKVPEVIANHEEVAEHYKVSSINLAKEVTDRIDAGEFNWEDDFKNLHPSPFGQNIYFQSMKIFLENAWSGFVAEDDKLTSYELPEMLTPSCYANGVLIPANKVQAGKGWKVAGKWDPEDGKGTRPNYVNVPMLINEGVGQQLKFEFEGNTVGIAVAAGPDAGIIEYKIDRGEWQKQDLFTKWSSGLHLPWYFTLAANLENEKHVLRLRLTDEKNGQSSGSACRIRYFYVNQLQ